MMEKINDRNKIRAMIDLICPISENSFNEFYELLEYENYSKGDIIIEKGKTNRKEYFIFEGICRSVLYNPNGEEVTIAFFADNTVLSPHTARSLKGISIYYFRALTDMKLATIYADKFESLMIQNLEIRNLGYTIMIRELSQKVEKEIAMASMTAKERLVIFRKKYPLFENLIPHTYIASYLGITNISLSRLRRELLNGPSTL